MNKKNKPNWQLLGTIAGVCAAPFTGGVSLWATGGLGLVGGSLIEATGFFNNNSDDSALNSNLETWKIQHEQWQKLVDNNREEAKRLREEQDKKEKEIKKNNDEMDRVRAIINNPHSSEEEKSNAKKRLILLEDENKKLKKVVEGLETTIKDKEKTPPAPPRPLGSYLPKLKFMDKVILASSITLLTYLIIIKDDKKK